MSHQSELIATDIDAYLAQHERKDLLRLLTCGSVDDGKSTLIGRLLHDTHMIYEDQLQAIKSDSLNANRASRSTSPTVISPPRNASSLLPTRPATSSTRATWPPARPTASWRSF
jgi:hypothetical protein